MKRERNWRSLGGRVLQQQTINEASQLPGPKHRVSRDRRYAKQTRRWESKTHNDDLPTLNLPIPPPVTPQPSHRAHHRTIQQVPTVRQRMDRYTEVQDLAMRKDDAKGRREGQVSSRSARDFEAERGERTFSPATIHKDSLSTASDFLIAFSSRRVRRVSSSEDLRANEGKGEVSSSWEGGRERKEN